MKTALLIFILTSWISHSIADANIKLQFNDSSFKTGEIVSAQLTLDSSSVQNFPLQSLKGQVLSGTLYFQSISPLIHRENQSAYGSEAEVIFIKKPEARELSLTIGNTPILISWNEVEVIPVEAPQKFIFMNFEIPFPSKILLWISILVGCLVIVWILWKLKLRLDSKNQLRNSRRQLKEEILSCRNYDEVVQLWQKKRIYLKHFPEIEAPLQKMETTLFKFQFKPVQTETEKNQAMDAYREFRKEMEGALSGV